MSLLASHGGVGKYVRSKDTDHPSCVCRNCEVCLLCVRTCVYVASFSSLMAFVRKNKERKTRNGTVQEAIKTLSICCSKARILQAPITT